VRELEIRSISWESKMKPPLQRMKIRQRQYGRYDPISNTFGNVRHSHTGAHQGWDLVATPGSPVFAIADGELKVGKSDTYGNWISLKFMHAQRELFAFYAHLQGACVGNCSITEGSLIGFAGRTGNANQIPLSEAHLHFEIRTKESPGHKLDGRIDPGEVFGYHIYSCSN
jgi:murein DD-endopeptidase MepM/ murein hydrolase activator NlpD